MGHVREVTRDELGARREGLLAELGLTLPELESRAASGSLAGEEWSTWERIRDIDYLLNDVG